jgi:TrmH family RNA methyltransferase
MVAPRVVLNRPLYGGNVGSSARAMANFGLRELHVVGKQFKDLREMDTFAVSSGRSIIAEMSETDVLGDALGDCTVVVACTARPRRWKAWSILNPGDSATLLAERAANGEKTAILFGAEDSGLSEEDLRWATHICHIPTASEASSLNLSQAVLLLAWEWGQAHGRISRRPHKNRTRPPAELNQVQGAAQQIGSLMDRVNFFKGKSRDHGLATIRQTLLRGNLTDVEIHYLRGVVNKLRWYVDHGKRKDELPAEPADQDPAGDASD